MSFRGTHDLDICNIVATDFKPKSWIYVHGACSQNFLPFDSQIDDFQRYDNKKYLPMCIRGNCCRHSLALRMSDVISGL